MIGVTERSGAPAAVDTEPFGWFDDDTKDASSFVCFLVLAVFLAVAVMFVGKASSLGSFLASMPTISLQMTEHLISSSLHEIESGTSYDRQQTSL